MVALAAVWVALRHHEREVDLSSARLVDLTGQAVELPETGPYVVYFWASWCGVCKKESSPMTDWLAELPVPVFKIATFDSLSAAKEAVATWPLAGTVWVDSGGGLAGALGVQGLPTMMILSGEGQVLARFDGRLGAQKRVAVVERLGQLKAAR